MDRLDEFRLKLANLMEEYSIEIKANRVDPDYPWCGEIDGVKYSIPEEYTVTINGKELFLVKSNKYFIRESIDEIIYIKADSKGGTMIILGANGFIDIKQDTKGYTDISNTTSITEEEFETVYKETLLKLK